MKTPYELCPECRNAPTTRPGLPCGVCVHEQEQLVEKAAREKAVDDRLRSIMDRMCQLSIQKDCLVTADSKRLGQMICTGFEILFDLVTQTSDPITRQQLARAFSLKD